MVDIFIFGILQRAGYAGSRLRIPPMPREIKGSFGFHFGPDLKVPNSAVEVPFFAMIVIEGNKLLMADLFRVSYGRSLVVKSGYVCFNVLEFRIVTNITFRLKLRATFLLFNVSWYSGRDN